MINIVDIFDTLQILDCASKATSEIFSEGTRDNPNLTVFRDTRSGVIYIDKHYVGDEEYRTGHYRKSEFYQDSAQNYERLIDRDRRTALFKQFFTGRDICDFGCGAGDFLLKVRRSCRTVQGVELQYDYMKKLNDAGVPCVDDLDKLPDNSIDTLFSFHTIEHLPDPINKLKMMKQKIRRGGFLVIEVPHARDILLSDHLDCQEFRRFTLWSQHLILHTSQSLRSLLEHCSFDSIIIEGIQRYPISNHFRWLAHGAPGGHRSALSALDSPDLHTAYAAALAKIDMTDTLIAISKVG